MCGIAGCLSWFQPPDSQSVRRMTACLSHRGPDDEGFFCRGAIALGHRRLAIIDVSAVGRQPMTRDGGCWIVFNGEIYNFQELRRQLESEGVRFSTATDTEVILAAYARWDVDCLARLNGMFAFAIWDAPRERLFLARDRAGEKPLFYHVRDDRLVFASDANSLLEHAGVPRRINPEALAQFLALGYTLGASSFIDGVRRLEPAHALLAARGAPVRSWRYWDLADHYRRKTPFRDEAEAAGALSALIDDSVRLRLISDVPLGAFLSGGLDSSTIVAAMRRHRPADQTHTFSIGFDEPTFDESPEARRVASALDVVHRDRIVGPDMSVELPRLAAFLDEPLADTSAIPMYFLAGFAREHVTVCLSGDGGDENFAGYDTYAADRLRRLTAWVPGPLARAAARGLRALLPVQFDKVGAAEKLRRFLSGHALDAQRAHYSWRLLFDRTSRRRLLRPALQRLVDEHDPFQPFAALYDDVRGCDPLDQALYVDVKTWLCDDILVKVDRMTMAHSLESRAPFLDHQLLEFAAALPARWKLNGWRRKHILKRSQRGTLPAETLRRAKRGFNAPVSHWFNGPLEAVGRRAFDEGALGEWFEPREVDRVWSEHRAGSADHGLLLFAMTGLGLWRSRTGATL